MTIEKQEQHIYEEKSFKDVEFVAGGAFVETVPVRKETATSDSFSEESTTDKKNNSPRDAWCGGCRRGAETRTCCCKILIGLGIVIPLFVLVMVATLFIGAAIETKRSLQVPPTVVLYDTDQVCGLHKEDNATISTFRSVEEARWNDTARVAHCGPCGECSTVQDMEIMGRTKETLTGDATRCALFTFWSMRTVSMCLRDRVGFTDACNQCWVDNIRCTFAHCKFTCLKSRLVREQQNPGGGRLNSCLECDERMCGPAFLRCSGANRRRLGIVSDIGRDANKEQCNQTDLNWETGPYPS